jgi:hypothetical protein
MEKEQHGERAPVLFNFSPGYAAMPLLIIDHLRQFSPRGLPCFCWPCSPLSSFSALALQTVRPLNRHGPEFGSLIHHGN